MSHEGVRDDCEKETKIEECGDESGVREVACELGKVAGFVKILKKERKVMKGLDEPGECGLGISSMKRKRQERDLEEEVVSPGKKSRVEYREDRKLESDFDSYLGEPTIIMSLGEPGTSRRGFLNLDQGIMEKTIVTSDKIDKLTKITEK